MAIRRCTLRSALPVLAFASALALSGCSGGADAESQGPPTASPSASATATPTPSVDSRPTPASSTGPARNLPKPEMPAAAKENTKAGFEAFTQYWLDTVTYAYETGDSAAITAVSDPGCKVCASMKKTVDSLYAGNGWSKGPKWTVSDFHSTMKIDPAGRAEGFYLVTEAPNQRFDASGRVTKDMKGTAEPAAQVIYGIFKAGEWKTAETGNVK
ncbi:DUF6318 family protein [Sinomonas sp. RB5]